MTRTAIYARSPDCSLSADRQIDELKRFAAERGWAVEHVFTDHPTSVKKGQDRRSGELALVHAIQSVAVEKVLMWSLCRIGKPLTELITFLETCRSAGVALYLDQEKIDSAETNSLSLFEVSKLLALPTGTEFCAVRLRPAHCRSDMDGRLLESRRWRRPSWN
jgi:DNA invertase Pin-like site-specific DNA recombinase